MAVLPLTQGADNQVLRAKSSEVKKIDRKIKKLVSDMTDTMNAADGLGIAAPQVGVNLRIFIARLNFNTPQEVIVPMVNPEIVHRSKEIEKGEEGCLSLPKRFGIVPRAHELTVNFTDQKGQSHTLQLSGLNAKIIQHETDHIDGKLFVDSMEREIPPEELEERRLKNKTSE